MPKIKYIEQKCPDSLHKHAIILLYYNNKNEYRNEKLLLSFILYFLLIRSDYNLENITFM